MVERAPPELWTELPAAKRLLAQAVANPPAAHEFRYDDGREWRYIGDIPRKLKAIREPFLDRVLRGSDQAAKVRNFKLTVTKAIDEARAAAGVGEVVEDFRVERAA